MAQHTKADKITVEERLNVVLNLIYRGWQTQKIAVNVSKLWGIEVSQARNYVYTARGRIEQMYRHAQKQGLEEMIARHNDLRDKGYQDKDHRLVLDVDKEDAKLLGLYAPEKHEVSLSGADLDRAIERELARLAGAGEEGAAGEDTEPPTSG